MLTQRLIHQWRSGLNFTQCSRWITLRIAPYIILLTGCAQVQIPTLSSPQPLKQIALNWQINATLEAGAYQISGKTDLPDRTQLTVAAFRYLYPTAKLNRNPTYAILDYQAVAVENGTWQTQLNLWQIAPDGTFQENWQLDQQNLATRFNPGQEVVFLVTLTPIDQLVTLQKQFAARGEKLAPDTIRTTAEGELYAQSRQTLAVGLPSGGATAARPQLEAENFGWGKRYLIPQEPPNLTRLELPTERQTNAPVRPEAYLR